MPTDDATSAWPPQRLDPVPSETPVPDRPVTAGMQRAIQLHGQVSGLMDHMVAELSELVAALRQVSEPGAALAQLEAMEAQTAARVAEAEGQAARARQAQLQAEAERAQALSAADDALVAKAGIAAELEEMRRRLTAVEAERDAQLEQLREKADQLQAATERAKTLQRRLFDAEQTVTVESELRAAAEAAAAVEAERRTEALDALAAERARADEAASALEEATAEARRSTIDAESVREQIERSNTARVELSQLLAAASAERDRMAGRVEQLRETLTEAAAATQAARDEAADKVEDVCKESLHQVEAARAETAAAVTALHAEIDLRTIAEEQVERLRGQLFDLRAQLAIHDDVLSPSVRHVVVESSIQD